MGVDAPVSRLHDQSLQHPPHPPAPPEAETPQVVPPQEKTAGERTLNWGWCILILPRQGTLKRFECAFEGFEGTLSKEYSQCPCSSNCKGIHREEGQPTPRHPLKPKHIW